MQVLEKSPVVFFNSNLSQCHVQEVGRGNIVYFVLGQSIVVTQEPDQGSWSSRVHYWRREYS